MVLRLFFAWEQPARVAAGREPLCRLRAMLSNARLRGGLTMFFFQFLIQAGLFFVVPLFLSVALGLTRARDRRAAAAAVGHAAGGGRRGSRSSSRTRRRGGWCASAVLALLAGIVVADRRARVGAGAEIVTVPLLLAGSGVGALASQLGAVTVSAVPDEQSGEVGGLQNTMTNLGASLGTALAGSVLIATLTATLLVGVGDNPDGPRRGRVAGRQVELAGGRAVRVRRPAGDRARGRRRALRRGDAIVDENATARIQGLRAALFVIALMSVLALFFTGRVRDRPASSAPTPSWPRSASHPPFICASLPCGARS